MKLNLGCGAQVVDGWINVDYALGAKLSKSRIFQLLNKQIKLFNLEWDNRIYIHNLTKPFPWNNNSVDIVYSSHTLEHFSREDGLIFLKECHRVLKPGGIIRILVPDLQCIVDDYNNKVFPATDFIQSLDVLYQKKSTKLKSYLATFIQFPHKCMYDTPTLVALLEQIGFDAKSEGPNKSKIDDIDKIELENRTIRAVIVEGIKK